MYLGKKWLLSATCALLTAAPFAHAFDWVTREVAGVPVTIPSGESRALAFDGTYQVKNLVIQARAIGSAATLDVMVNGEVKGTLYIPGQDPSYVVTIGEATNSIQFISRGGGGTVRVERVLATISDAGVTAVPRPIGSILLIPANEVTALSARVIDAVDALLPWTTADNADKYLMPIKIAAGRLYAVASSRGPLSKKTATAIAFLLTQFDASAGFFDQALTCRECFPGIVNLLAIRERLEHATN